MAHPDANIIFGTVIDDTLGDEVRVTVIAAGFDGGILPRLAVPTLHRQPDPAVRQSVNPLAVGDVRPRPAAVGAAGAPSVVDPAAAAFPAAAGAAVLPAQQPGGGMTSAAGAGGSPVAPVAAAVGPVSVPPLAAPPVNAVDAPPQRWVVFDDAVGAEGLDDLDVPDFLK